MNQTRARLLGATVGALLAFAIGGAGLANAQTADDGSTTTAPPAATAPAPDAGPGPGHHRGDGNCPNMGGDDGGADATTAPTPAAPSANPSDV
jgi:hypothetical protein